MTDNEKKITPFWEKKKEQKKTFKPENITFYVKVIVYSFSLLMILWSFIQSFATPWTNYDPSPGVGLEFGFLPGDHGVDDYKFVLGSWSIAGPRYHAFFKPTLIYGPFLSWFVYPFAKVFMLLMWGFYNRFESLRDNGLYVIFSMLIIMFCMRFITFWTTLRSSIYQEKQALHQPFLDAINNKYEKYDFTDKQAKLRKHQEISNYYKKHNLKPLVILENFFINTPIFLIVFRLITICRPIKFATLFGIWDLSKKPSSMVFHEFTNYGWAYLLLCLVIIPVNFSSQKITSWLANLRNNASKKEVIDKNSQTYKMQRIQKIMSVMFLLFTFFWSTSLAIYYFFNSIFTIFQSLIIHQILKSRKKKRNLFEIKLKKLGV